MDKKENVSIILGILCFIGLTIYAIIEEKYAALIVLGIMLLFVIGVIIWSNVSLNSFNKANKKINDKYYLLKEKFERTTFEECYVLSIKEELEKRIYQEIKENKLKDVGGIYTDIVVTNRVDLYYRYRGFDICIMIKEDEVSYQVDTPTRYDGMKNNDEFEKKNKTQINPKEFYNFDNFIKNIYSLMIEINEEIVDFADVNKTDEIFNGRMFNKIKPLQMFWKSDGLAAIIGGPFFIALFSLGICMAFIDTNYKNENLGGFIVCVTVIPAFLIFFIFLVVVGILRFKGYLNSKKDLELKQYSIKEEKAIKVRVEKHSYRHSNCIFMNYIALYFKDETLYIPLNNTILKNKRNLNIFYSECLKVKTKLKYLTKSKIIFDGENKYLSLMKKYIT